MPVLVLTARGTWQERVEGIEAGADDYLPKPFRMEELIARARALVRRAGGHAAALQEAGDLSLDTNRMGVALRGVPVQVTALEYRLLAYLMLHRTGRAADRVAGTPLRRRRRARGERA
jgi:two-component system OmpR family response regulator